MVNFKVLSIRCMRAKFDTGQIISDYLSDVAPALNAWQYRTLNALSLCRTSALGGHVDACTDCGTIRYSYNSCRNRHCPKCQSSDKERWMMDREAELLPVPYYHVVFTVPDLLNELFLANQQILYSLLFKVAWQTIYNFGWDYKFVGADMGMTSILHTWGQTLSYHPHLHCIVPGGGLSIQGKWRSAKGQNKRFIFPVKAMGVYFRGKFSAELARLNSSGKLRYNGNFKQLINASYKKKWVVYAKSPFLSPQSVIEYLGRYTHKSGISNNRIANYENDQVTFRYKDYRDSKQKLMTLHAHEFIRRLSLHILPKGFVKIRHYGFLASKLKRELLSLIMKSFGKQYNPADKKLAWEEICKNRLGFDPFECPICKGQMIRIKGIPPIRSPPNQTTTKPIAGSYIG